MISINYFCYRLTFKNQKLVKIQRNYFNPPYLPRNQEVDLDEIDKIMQEPTLSVGKIGKDYILITHSAAIPNSCSFDWFFINHIFETS